MPKNTIFCSLISQNWLMMLREIFLYIIKQGVDNIISKNYRDLYGRSVFKNSLKIRRKMRKLPFQGLISPKICFIQPQFVHMLLSFIYRTQINRKTWCNQLESITDSSLKVGKNPENPKSTRKCEVSPVFKVTFLQKYARYN